MLLLRPADRKRGRSGKKVWLPVFIVFLIIGMVTAWYFLFGPGSPSKTASQSGISYQTTTVKSGNIRISTNGEGSLVASTSIDLSFPVKGTLAELNVKLGDQVTAGKVLARLGRSLDLEAALNNSELAYLQAQKTLTDLQSSAGVTLATAYKTLTAAKQDYVDAVAANRRTEFNRCSSDVIVKYTNTLERAKEKLNGLSYGTDAWLSAKQAYDTAEANLAYCSSYTTEEKNNTKAALDLAEAALKTAQDKYDTLKSASGLDPQALSIAEAKVASSKTSLDQAKLNLSNLDLIAPINGTVIYLTSTVGAAVGTTKFITIADLTHPSVSVSVDETDVSVVKVGMSVEVTFDAFPNQVFSGKIASIEPSMVSSGQYKTVRGLIELDQSTSKALQSYPIGLNASVELIKQESKNTLFIPKEALRDLGNNEYAVFVLGSDGRLRLTTVKIGLTDSTRAEIKQGLTAGQIVSTGKVPTSK